VPVGGQLHRRHKFLPKPGGWYLAFIVSEVNGRWGQAQEIADSPGAPTATNAAVESVSCPSAGDCLATDVFSGSALYIVNAAAP
jgi:hypothetical protein